MSILGNLKTSQVFFCQLINHFFLNQKSDDESRLFRVCDEASFRALSLVRTVWTALHKCSEKSNEYSATNSAPPAQLTQMSFWKALEKQSGTSSLLTAELKFLKTTEKPPPLLPSLALKVSPPTKIKKTAKKSVTVGFSEKPEGIFHIPLKSLGNKCPVFFGHFENLSLVAVQFLNAE